MEAPRFNFAAAYSTLSNGPDVPVSGNGSHEARCANEIQVEGPKRGLRYLCVAMLHKKLWISYYKPCAFDGKCPLNQFIAIKKTSDYLKELDAKKAQGNGNGLK